MILRRRAYLLGLLAAVTSSCGGTDKGRPTEQATEPVAVDMGSKPVLCGVTDDYEFQTIQDFETGSVTGGWYFNNDLCDKCQKVIDRIKELTAARTPVLLENSTEPIYPDKYGCNNWALKQQPDETAEAYEVRKGKILEGIDKEIETRERQLIEGDPENNVRENCRDVCNASQTPNAYVKPLAASVIQFKTNGVTTKTQPRCNSRFAMHVQAGPLQTWGGAFAVQLGSPGLDASGWDGISFWARVGPSSRHPLRIEISDWQNDDKQMMYVFPGQSQVTPVTREGLREKNPDGTLKYDYFDTEGDPQSWCSQKLFICNSDSVREDKNGCDKYGANRSMSGDWQFFAIDFSEFRQSGWGMTVTEPPMDPNGQPAEIATSQLRSLNFMWTTGTWDVWIDDIALFRRKQ